MGAFFQILCAIWYAFLFNYTVYPHLGEWTLIYNFLESYNENNHVIMTLNGFSSTNNNFKHTQSNINVIVRTLICIEFGYWVTTSNKLVTDNKTWVTSGPISTSGLCLPNISSGYSINWIKFITQKLAPIVHKDAYEQNIVFIVKNTHTTWP